MSLILTEQLSKTYGDHGHPVRALHEVNLAVEEAEFLAVMGPSGSGKSTLLYLLGGLDRPTSGKVRLRDTDLGTLSDEALSRLRRKQMGFVFQFYNLLPILGARENVAIPLILDGMKRSEALERADAILARVGLAERAAHRPAELSGGEQQRVAIARAMVTDPAVILADEPTGNLDSQSGDEVVALLRRAASDWGRTIVMVTHDPRIAAHADRIIFLKDGQIVDENRLKGQGNADDIRAQLGKLKVE
jgi:putative ABC transport system ATP-binding protein